MKLRVVRPDLLKLRNVDRLAVKELLTLIQSFGVQVAHGDHLLAKELFLV